METFCRGTPICNDDQGDVDRATARQQLAVVYCLVLGVRADKAGHLNRNTYLTVTVTLFLIVAIVHLLRIILGWHVKIGGLSIPLWVSWLAGLVAGALAYFGFGQHRQLGRYNSGATAWRQST
jgi:hypothetical protein